MSKLFLFVWRVTWLKKVTGGSVDKVTLTGHAVHALSRRTHKITLALEASAYALKVTALLQGWELLLRVSQAAVILQPPLVCMPLS